MTDKRTITFSWFIPIIMAIVYLLGLGSLLSKQNHVSGKGEVDSVTVIKTKRWFNQKNINILINASSYQVITLYHKKIDQKIQFTKTIYPI